MGGVVITQSLQKWSHLRSTPARAGDRAEISDSQGQGWVCRQARAFLCHRASTNPLPSDQLWSHRLVSMSLPSPWHVHVASVLLWWGMWHVATNSQATLSSFYTPGCITAWFL